MAKITQTFTADFNQIAREYDKLLAKQVKMEEQLRKVRRAADQSSQQTVTNTSKLKTVASSAIESISGVVAGYVGMQTAINGVNLELAKKAKFENDALKLSQSLANAEAGLVINLGNKSTEFKEEYLKSIDKIAVEAKFPDKKILTQSVSSTISATGDAESARAIVGEIAPLFQSIPEQLEAASQAAGDLMNTAKTTAKETSGLMASTMSQSRLVGPGDLKNMAPGINAAVASQPGIEPKIAARESAVLFATLTKILADKDGSVSASAEANLSANLQRNFPRDERRYQKLISQGASIEEARNKSALSVLERLELTQAGGDRIKDFRNRGLVPASDDAEIKPIVPVFQNAFQVAIVGAAQQIYSKDLEVQKDILKNGFEGKTKGSVAQLISGNDTGNAKVLDQINPQVTFDSSYFDRLAGQVSTVTDNLVAADSAAKSKAEIQGLQSTTGIQLKGQMREAFDTGISETGYETTGSGVGSFFAARRGNLNELMGTERQGRINALESQKSSILKGNVFGIGPERSIDQLSTRERKEVGFIDTQIEEINRLQGRYIDQMEHVSDSLAKIAENLSNNKDAPAAVRSFSGSVLERRELQESYLRNRPGGNAAVQSRVHDERD